MELLKLGINLWRIIVPLNDAAYGMETQENSMKLNPINQWEIDDRVWMLKNMSFDVLDLQKHRKKNHFTGRVA